MLHLATKLGNQADRKVGISDCVARLDRPSWFDARAQKADDGGPADPSVGGTPQ